MGGRVLIGLCRFYKKMEGMNMKTLIHKFKMIMKALYFCCCCIVLAAAVTGAAYFSGALKQIEVKEIEKIIEIPEDEPTLDELLAEAPKHGMPAVIAKVLMIKEDAGRYRKNAKRCEWESKEWLRIASTIEPRDTEQRDAYRCSYGPFQVAGWHAPTYQMVWSDLLVPRNNLEVAAAVWGNCLEQSKKANQKASESTHLRNAFRCYNGSGPRAETYAAEAMEILGKIAIEKMFSDL